MSVTGSVTVEIVHSVCRRRWTFSQKLRMVEETLQLKKLDKVETVAYYCLK